MFLENAFSDRIIIMSLDDVVFVKLPEASVAKLGLPGLTADTMIPVQLPAGEKTIDPSKGIGIESIVAGMMRVIAHDPENKACDFYRNAVLSAQPDTVQQLSTAGIAKTKNGDYALAEEIFLILKNLSPAPENYINLAVLYAQMTVDSIKANDQEKADFYDDKTLNTLKEGLAKFPEDTELMAEAGVFHLREGNNDMAKKYFDMYLEKAEDSPKKDKIRQLRKKAEQDSAFEEKLNEIHDAIIMDKCDKAVGMCDEMLKSASDSWELFFLKGWALRCENKYSEAKTNLLKCIELGVSDISEIYNELAMCEREEGNREMAKSYLEMAIEHSEEEISFVLNLAFLQIEDGQFEEAYENLSKAMRMDINDPQLSALIEFFEQKSGARFVIPEDIEKAATGHHHCCCGHHHEGEEHECKCGHQHEGCCDEK